MIYLVDRGLSSRSLAETILSVESHFVPRLGWFVASRSSTVGLREETVLSVAWTCLLACRLRSSLGTACRFSAILAWFLHLCAAKSGGFLSYGMDNFMTIGLFYLMLSPLPDRYAVDWRLRKLRPKNPQFLGFWRRVLQLHLCVIYFFSGLTKCLGAVGGMVRIYGALLSARPLTSLILRYSYDGSPCFPVAGIFICLLGNRISIFYLE